MDPMLLIGGGIAALLLSKKSSAPVTAEQVQVKTDEAIQQKAPDSIGVCVKLVKPPYIFPPEPAWMAYYNAEIKVILERHQVLGGTRTQPIQGLPPYGSPTFQAYLDDMNVVQAKYQSRLNEKSATLSASMAKWNSDYETILEGYRQRGWKITQVRVGGIVPSAPMNYAMMEKMGDLGQIGTIIGQSIGNVLSGMSGTKMSGSTITYACPPGTLPIEYQGAIANSIKKNECIVLRSTDSYISACMCGSAYTAVPQDVIDALKAKGWTEKTVTPPPPPPPAPGTPSSPWDAILRLQMGASSTTYLCPAGKEPPPPPASVAQTAPAQASSSIWAPIVEPVRPLYPLGYK